jgi:hypothetical protein
MISAIFISAEAGTAEDNTKAKAETTAGIFFITCIYLSGPDEIET